MKAFVVGASNVDIIAKSEGKTVAGDSNPGTVEKAPGGVGRNIAFALKSLGFEVSLGTKRNVSNPSNTERNIDNLPPSEKVGLILSTKFLNAFI